ncbi:hypothetical protein EDD11_009631 [Mortierella claussenii]|nr:hypothetical protein EDD11_009631 [Mortierella claussenii]
MLTNLGSVTVHDEHQQKQERIISPLPLSAVYNKEHFISQFISLHYASTQPTLVHQLLSNSIPHTTAEFWIMFDDYNQPVACAGANTAISDPSVGYVGLFEAKTEKAGTAVLRAATEWLKRGGLQQFEPVRQILGPVNMTTWLQYRLRVDDVDEPSMSFEPRHPKFYQQCFAQAGFVKAADYYSNFYQMDAMLKVYPMATKGDTLERHGLKLQPWNTLDLTASLSPERHSDLTHEDDVARRIHEVTLGMFRGKALFDEQVSRLTHRQVVLNDMISRLEVDHESMMDLSSFVVDMKTGEDVGYFFCWVENKDTFVMKTAGFLEKLWGSKVYPMAILESLQRAKDHWGCTRVACALMNDFSTAICEKIAGRDVQHVCRLYMYKGEDSIMQTDKGQGLQQPKQQRQSSGSPSSAVLEAVTAAATAIPAVNDQTVEQLQKQQDEKKLQMYLEHQRWRQLSQHSRGRAMARL